MDEFDEWPISEEELKNDRQIRERKLLEKKFHILKSTMERMLKWNYTHESAGCDFHDEIEDTLKKIERL